MTGVLREGGPAAGVVSGGCRATGSSSGPRRARLGCGWPVQDSVTGSDDWRRVIALTLGGGGGAAGRGGHGEKIGCALKLQRLPPPKITGRVFFL